MLYDTRSGWVGTLLSLIGAVVIAYFLIQEYATAEINGWIFALGLAALACWLVVAEWGAWSAPVWLLTATCVVMTVVGAIGAAPSNGLLIVPAAIGILRLVGDPRIALWIGCASALLSAALVAIGSLTVPITPIGVLSLEGGLALGLLGGLNRRQSRAARERENELIERTMAAREEHARASALEARQRVARDIHDVLAHSLGGMVVQLDAVEALLESGRLPEAQTRIRDARSLAASGLGEARRAVEALRSSFDVEQAVTSDELSASLADLAEAHERMSGRIEFTVSGEGRTLPGMVAVALRRAMQEALANARKHAPGEPVRVRLVWETERVVLTVTNPLPAPPTPALSVLARSGGGNGLPGMHERFAELPGGEFRAGVRQNTFVVEAGADG